MGKKSFTKLIGTDKTFLMMNLETGEWERYDPEKVSKAGFDSYDIIAFSIPIDKYYFLDLTGDWPLLRWMENGRRKQKKADLWGGKSHGKNK